MNRRYSASEKGKGIAPPTDDSGPRRMKASYLDTINLVKENALTLIGHITNPQEQCMWALNPSLPRKWNLRGRAVGSDLGHNCFQYIFDREDDLQSVLDNMPYQFGYWMVILQKWEPVISSSFPSQIPFWIRIKGLPLHYWDARVLCGIGKELGTLENHVLTKTSAKVRVSIDGIKGLTKDTVMDFETWEECTLTFEYENLENHCSACGSLSQTSWNMTGIWLSRPLSWERQAHGRRRKCNPTVKGEGSLNAPTEPQQPTQKMSMSFASVSTDMADLLEKEWTQDMQETHLQRNQLSQENQTPDLLQDQRFRA